VPLLPSSVHWHFIGHLQKNKVRKVLPLVDLVHGVDSLELALDIDRIASELGLLQWEGLMTIAPIVDAPDNARPFFAQLRMLRDQIAAENRVDLPTLSMGMSDDFEAAIKEGATLVRLGTVIFGPRGRA
jgi:uncharacterized pyridoxal phosphate-containing UPF0001 family protein